MFLANKKAVGYILMRCKVDIVIVAVMTIILSFADNYLPNDQAFPLTIPSLLGTALSLILAFRTGQAYDRWWEARKLWGAIVNDSRNLVRSCKNFTSATKNAEIESFVRSMALRQIAWVYAFGNVLRNTSALQKAKQFLSEVETKTVKGRANVPNAILELHSETINSAFEKGLVNDFGRLRLEEIVMRLTDSMGGCERIKGTVFPTPYSRFVHLTIYVFAITLTMGIADFNGFIEIPVTVIITTLFLALERVALLLQDPWENNPSDIPVRFIAAKIEYDLKQMIDDENLPEPAKDEGYFVM